MDAIALVIEDLKSFGNPNFKAGMARFGINTELVLGIKIPVLRNYAKKYKKDHELALALWETGIHEARLLAIFIDDYRQVTDSQMESWVRDFNSWDICDQACGLFDKSPLAFEKAKKWSQQEEEFIKRAGFALMATSAVHNKKASDEQFLELFPFIEKQAWDERNFVKKAVNWAIRQIGKRNEALLKEAIALSHRIQAQNSKSARWIASDALRELKKNR
jgi:3-methyladenine DNA glycosylase AlkD